MKPRHPFLRDTRATAAAEMALVLPAIAYLFINVADLSIYLFSKMQVDLAAQEAVGAARVVCSGAGKIPATINCSSLTTTMTSAAQSTSLGSTVTINTPTEAWYCSTASGTLTQVATAASTTVPADCSATIAGSKAVPGDYISTTSSYAFSSLFPNATVAAVLPATITSTAWMRLK